MNPGGSVKDRPAAAIVAAAEAAGQLVPRQQRRWWQRGDYTLVEATGGNTGIAMALLANASGYRCVFTVPESIAVEKIELMRVLGAEVELCPLVPFTDPRHFYHRSRAIAAERPRAVWGNQFETLANMRAHYEGTGAELVAQARGPVHGVVMAAGTGGTLAGVGQRVREAFPAAQVWLIDPPGSALADYVERGEMGAPVGRSDAIEGVGLARLTGNFAAARPDGAFRGTDQEAVAMAYYLLRREGVFVGPSAALNVVGAVKLARRLGPGHTVATVLCDSGERYRSKIYSAAWLQQHGLSAEVDCARDHADFVQ